MELKNKNTPLNLNLGEEIVYYNQTTKPYYYIHVIGYTMVAVFVCFLLLRLVAIYGISADARSLWIYAVIAIGAFSAYKRMRDYEFVDFILTNQRIIVIEFNKFSSIAFEDVDYIQGIQYITRPSMVKIRLKNHKTFLIDFVDAKELNEKLKSFADELKIKK